MRPPFFSAAAFRAEPVAMIVFYAGAAIVAAGAILTTLGA